MNNAQRQLIEAYIVTGVLKHVYNYGVDSFSPGAAFGTPNIFKFKNGWTLEYRNGDYVKKLFEFKWKTPNGLPPPEFK